MHCKPHLALAAMQKRPTSKSRLCGSWVRVDMREVSYFSSDRHGQKRFKPLYTEHHTEHWHFTQKEAALGPSGGDRKGTQTVLQI